VSDLRQRIANLSPDKRALLERQLLEKSHASGDARRIPRRAPAETYPLSHTQRRLWYLAQWQPESAAYNAPSAFRLRGPLDADCLHESLDALVKRHESLRTTFRTIGGAPAQRIAPSAALPRTTLDLSARPEAERETELARALRAECGRPFDLSRDLMLRALLVRLGREEHVLLLVTHHIASDGFSSAILHRELSALYSARLRNAAPTLQELPIQYADFACWQQGASHAEMLARHLAYWKRQLDGAPLELELPSDRPRPAARTDGGARVYFNLPGKLVRSVAGLSKKPGVTLFMTLLAAFDVLLHRCTGLEDLLVGTPIANRTKPELEDLIGFFANTLVMRADLSGDPTFLEILQRTCKTALDAYAHQDMPFDRLVEELHPARDLGRTPLIQVAFALQNTPAKPLQLPGVEAERIEVQTGTAKFDLLLNMTETPGGLSAWFEYSTDLFERETVARMAQHFGVLLEAIAADPGRRLSELPLLTEAERRRMLVDWNATATDFPKDRCVHQLFEEQVLRRPPEAVAIVDGDRRWTYAELNARANRMARRLLAAGVKPGARVCVLAERSPEMIAAFLAILKSGAAYVPLDPSFPRERLEFMIEDSGASVLMASEGQFSTVGSRLSAIKIVPLEGSGAAASPEENPGLDVEPEDLAYVIYTSGSTGEPKGVAVPHRAIVRLTMNTDYVRLDAASVVAQAATSSFDAATFEIWGPLLNGGRLVIVPKDVLLAPVDFDALAARHGINVLFLTTALFNEYAREMPSFFHRLRVVLFGGEAADPRSAAEVLRGKRPPGRLLHVYGPTEATTFATWHLVERVPEGARTIPIGRPIANTTVYILDRHMNPAPIGVTGEIYIGGPGVARGYLNRPELSAERFVPDPFSAEPSARLYKTGDLARYLATGEIEFVGRMDGQIKLRGFRVELGEIEAALFRHPAVKEAVVAVREDAPEGKTLAAYVIAKEPMTPSAPELRRFLEKTLPDYMVPATFTLIGAMPLTPNGKVDRRALPAPEHHRAPHTVRAAPRSATECQMVEIWKTLFNVPAVGVQDNFFDLGGHSLLAVRLLARIQEVFGKKLPLTVLFQAPTIEKLANALQEQAPAARLASMVAFQPSGSKRPLFCVAPTGPFEYAQFARRLGPDQPFYVFHPAELTGAELSSINVEALAARYLDELRGVQPEGPYLLGGLCAGGMIAYEMAQQLRAQGQRVALLALLDTPFPGSNLLFRRPRYLALRMAHHIAVFCTLKSRQRMEYVKGRWATLTRRRAGRAGPHNGVPPDDDSADDPLRSILRTYHYILPDYAPKPYGGYMVLFFAEECHMGLFTDSRKKWRRLATGRLELQVVPGRHQLMLTEPHAAVLAERLRDCLDRAQASEKVNAE
jgi:amino acid adenylation domain-containing protein